MSSLVDMLKELRGEKPAVYQVTSLEEFFVHKYRDVFRAQSSFVFPMRFSDARRGGTWSELSMVWNEKFHFLGRAPWKATLFHSDMFFWCDIGVFRSRNGKEAFPRARGH